MKKTNSKINSLTVLVVLAGMTTFTSCTTNSSDNTKLQAKIDSLQNELKKFTDERALIETVKKDSTQNAEVDLNDTTKAYPEKNNKLEFLAGCRGNACDYVELSATTNSKGHITSITIENVYDKPVKVQVEFQNLFTDSEPWTRINVPKNGSKTIAVSTVQQWLGASIKRANVIGE